MLIVLDDSFENFKKTGNLDRFLNNGRNKGGDMLNMDGLNSRRKWTTIVAKT